VALPVGRNARIPPILEAQSVAEAGVHHPLEENVVVAVEEARRNRHLEQRMSGRDALLVYPPRPPQFKAIGHVTLLIHFWTEILAFPDSLFMSICRRL